MDGATIPEAPRRGVTLISGHGFPGRMSLFIDRPRPIEKNLAIVCLVLNIIPLPGIGTLIYNVKSGDDKWVNAIGQIVLSITMILWILGLIWAVVDGVKIMQAAEPASPPQTVQTPP